MIENKTKGYFTVIGHPGMGKSAIASHYVNKYQIPCFFNDFTRQDNTADDFLKSIRGQLIKRYSLQNLENYG